MALSRALLTVITLLSFSYENHSLAQEQTPSSISPQQLMTLNDRTVVDIDGTPFYQTAYDGQLRRRTILLV
jgi:hypothetical protein